MKNLFFTALCAVMIIGCQQGPERYSTSGPEIDMVKALLANYEQGNWDAWNEAYADTAKVYYNDWDNALTAEEAGQGHQQSIAQVSSYAFSKDPIFYEKIIDDDGKTWVNVWGVWEATLKGNDKLVKVPVHLSINVEDGKIVEEYGFWDNSIFLNAVAEIQAMQDVPEAVQGE